MMYSKQGQATSEIFPWLQQKETILATKKKTYHLPLFGEIPHSYKALKTRTFRAAVRDTSPAPKRQPFSKITGRPDPKPLYPREGIYNPKYNLVYRRSPLLEEIHHQESLRRKSQVRTPKLSPDFEFVEKSLPSPKGYVELDKMAWVERFKLDEGAHESRFEYLNYPQSQYPRQVDIFIKSTVPPPHENDNKNGQIYDLNYSMIKPRPDKLTMSFQKLTSRKENKSPVYTLNESTSSQNTSPAHSFCIDKQLSREKAISQYLSTRRIYFS